MATHMPHQIHHSLSESDVIHATSHSSPHSVHHGKSSVVDDMVHIILHDFKFVTVEHGKLKIDVTGISQEDISKVTRELRHTYGMVGITKTHDIGSKQHNFLVITS